MFDPLFFRLYMSPQIRSYALPVAIVVGALFNGFFARWSFLSPYLIFAMLYITFSRVSLSELRVGWFHWVLLLFQIGLGAGLYFLLRDANEVVAQGVMICIFAPAAMASAVIGGMLGANVTTMTSFILMSNMSVALCAPVLFALTGGSGAEIGFWTMLWRVLKRVAPLLLMPLLLSWFTERFLPRTHAFVKAHQNLSFYLWVVVLTILMGNTTRFILSQPADNYSVEITLALSALVICLVQFAFGRWWGGRFDDKVAGGQSLGQKNMALAIWLTQSFLNPLASVAPAAYVVWQNLVNSYQLWRKNKSA